MTPDFGGPVTFSIIDIPLNRALGNVYANFDFSTFFFRVMSPYRDRLTDGGRARRVMRPI